MDNIKKQKKINYICSTIQNSDFAYNGEMSTEEYLSLISEIICQFDTDIAIEVMEKVSEKFGKEAKDIALAIKINYGY